MTNWLLKCFVKQYQDTENPAVRASYGRLAGIFGIFCNVLLFAAKLTVGILSGSVSILADAVNNLSDASSSVVTLLGFQLSKRPPDAEHPYGHARIEYLSGLGIAALILLVGAELLKSSVQKILHPEAVSLSWLLVAILLASVAVKLLMARFYRKLGGKIHSAALLASAADSRNDVLSTLAVLLACLIGDWTGLRVDGYAGLLVALFILWSGVGIAKDTISPLLGEAASPELVHMVRYEIAKYPEVLGIHDLIVHDYGPGRRFASVHVEMDASRDVLECHERIDSIERAFREKHGLDMVIHYDPIVTDDPELSLLREKIAAQMRSIDTRLSVHDFRMVRGRESSNVIFDLVVPFDLQGKKPELRALAERTLAEEGCYRAVITFDTPAVQEEI